MIFWQSLICFAKKLVEGQSHIGMVELEHEMVVQTVKWEAEV
jgi:hypothetical protein